MPPEHQDPESKNDPADISDEMTENPPPIAAPPKPPQLPTSENPATQKTYDWRKDITLGIEFLGLTALIVYSVFSILQWAQIRWTNRLTREALNASDVSLQQTLAKMQAQTEAINHLQETWSRSVGVSERTNKLQEDALEMGGASRPVLEIEGVGPQQFPDYQRVTLPQMSGLIILTDSTNFQFSIVNSGAGEARNIHYTISQPRPVRGDLPMNYIRQNIETEIAQNPLGFSQIGNSIPNLFGHVRSNPVMVNAKNAIPGGGASRSDVVEFLYGELDYDDIIGYGHHWQRIFCFAVEYRGPKSTNASIFDCGVKQEGVFAKMTANKRN